MAISIKEARFVVQIVKDDGYYVVDKQFFTSNLFGNCAHRFFYESQARAVARIMRKVSKQKFTPSELVVERFHAIGVKTYCITWFTPADWSYLAADHLKGQVMNSQDLELHYPEKAIILNKMMKLAEVKRLRSDLALAA